MSKVGAKTLKDRAELSLTIALEAVGSPLLGKELQPSEADIAFSDVAMAGRYMANAMIKGMVGQRQDVDWLLRMCIERSSKAIARCAGLDAIGEHMAIDLWFNGYDVSFS